MHARVWSNVVVGGAEERLEGFTLVDEHRVARHEADGLDAERRAILAGALLRARRALARRRFVWVRSTV